MGNFLPNMGYNALALLLILACGMTSKELLCRVAHERTSKREVCGVEA